MLSRYFSPSCLENVASLQNMDVKELRDFGRLPFPVLRKSGDPGFRQISWDEAYKIIAEKIRAIDSRRLAFYLTSRGLTNETYYVA